MPELLVDTQIIGRNAEEVAELLRRQGIALVGVTKGCLGEPAVGAAMLAGGAVALADTRDRNLQRLRAALPHVELQRIYLPPTHAPFEPGDITHVSSAAGAAAVAALAEADRRRSVMLTLETGDLREGVPAERLLEVAQGIAADPRIQLAGVATNYACFLGAADGLRASVETVAQAARQLRDAGMAAERVSGGNSSVLALVLQQEALPEEITEVRCGEALLLGHEALSYQAIPGCGCACTLRAEVLEEYTKPPHSDGRRRLVLGLGRQDLASGPVRFTDRGLCEIGRSGDYLVVEAGREYAGRGIGTSIEMIPSYEALVAAWTSPYVELRLR